MVEAGKQVRRVNGHLHLRSLRDTLEKVTGTVGATGTMRLSSLMIAGPPPKFHETRNVLSRNADDHAVATNPEASSASHLRVLWQYRQG